MHCVDHDGEHNQVVENRLLDNFPRVIANLVVVSIERAISLSSCSLPPRLSSVTIAVGLAEYFESVLLLLLFE